MNRAMLPIAAAGTASLGGELTVRRVGFGAMRISGNGIWGPPKDPASALAEQSPRHWETAETELPTR